MKYHTLCFSALLLFVSLLVDKPANANEPMLKGVIIVANLGDKKLTFTKQEIRNLFMGSFIGTDLRVYYLPKGHQTRLEFNLAVIGLTENRIQSYWAQMQFTGRKKQPAVIDDEKELITHLSNTPNAVAYVSSEIVIPDSLTVLYASQ